MPWKRQVPEGLGTWQDGKDRLDFGDFKYQFMNLESWKNKIKTTEPIAYHQSTKADVTISRTIPVHPQSLFELVSNLEYRKKWTHGIKKFIYKKDRVNRAGTSHVCVLNTGTVKVDSFNRKKGE